MRKSIKHAWPVYIAVTLAVGTLIAAAVRQSVGTSTSVLLLASVGEELTTYSVDVEQATLTKQSSVTLPGFVQEAWAAATTPYIYVAWSNGGSSYNGSGIAPAGDKHGVTAFRIESASGRLQAH